MTHIDAAKNEQKLDSLPEVERRLLTATHDLAATLGVEPRLALRALASVVQRRVDFERLRKSADTVSNRSSR